MTTEKATDKNEIVREYFNKVKQEMLTPEGYGEFKGRINDFYKVVQEYDCTPDKFIIIADAFMSFFKISEDESEKWLRGDTDAKMNILVRKYKNEEFYQLDEMFDIVINFSNILFHTGYSLSQPFYVQTGNRLLYTLTGSKPVLNSIETCLYMYPQKQKPDNQDEVLVNKLMDEKEHDKVMFQ